MLQASLSISHRVHLFRFAVSAGRSPCSVFTRFVSVFRPQCTVGIRSAPMCFCQRRSPKVGWIRCGNIVFRAQRRKVAGGCWSGPVGYWAGALPRSWMPNGDVFFFFCGQCCCNVRGCFFGPVCSHTKRFLTRCWLPHVFLCFSIHMSSLLSHASLNRRSGIRRIARLDSLLNSMEQRSFSSQHTDWATGHKCWMCWERGWLLICNGVS